MRNALVIAAVLALTGTGGFRARAEYGCSTPLASPLTPHRYHGVATIDGRIYVAGGAADNGFEEFDPRTASWQRLPPLPTPRAFAAVVAVAGRLYVIGGIGPARASVATVEVYDPRARTWQTAADLSSARDRLAAVAVGGRILAIGGLSTAGNLGTVEEFDPGSNRWRSRPGLRTPRHGHAAVEVGGRVLVMGGYGSSGSVLVSPLASVEALDPDMDAWVERAGLPTARGFFAAVAIGPAVYTLGGRVAGEPPIERYEVAADAWSKVGRLPAPRQRFGAAEIDGDIVMIGGEESPNDAVRLRRTCSREVAVEKGDGT